MKNDRNNWLDMAPDAILGYSAIVLGILCFLLVLALVVMAVRFITGVGVA